MTVWFFLMRANRGLWIQLVEERARALRYASHCRTWSSPTTNENSIVDTGTITFDESVTLQMEPDKYNQRVEEARAADQQSIRRAKGLLDTALDEMVHFREMHKFHTPSGRCWHVTPQCPTLANSQRIDEQAACSVCFNTHVTPFKNHQNTGTTFDDDIDEDCRHMHIINS